MRRVVALLAALVAAVPAFAGEADPIVRACDSSQFGDLGRGWQRRAVVAGPVSFVGMRVGYGRGAVAAAGPGLGRPLKVVVVVAPETTATVRIARRSSAYTSLGYNETRLRGGAPVPLANGTQSVRFEACGSEPSRPVWNRGTQFGGYFLVSGRRCVEVEIETGGRVVRRKLSFGARCMR